MKECKIPPNPPYKQVHNDLKNLTLFNDFAVRLDLHMRFLGIRGMPPQ